MNETDFGDNVLEDPSFETGYWSDRWDGIGGRTYTPTTDSRTGDQALAINGGAAWYLPIDTVDVEVGDLWRLSIWYRTEGAPDLDRGSGTVLRIRDAASSGDPDLRSAVFEDVGDEWTRATVIVTIPEGVDAITAQLYVTHSEGALVVDDISLQDYPPGSALLTGFEQRGLDGAWTTFSEESTYISALLTEVPNISDEVIGQGATGLDMRLYKVGTGPRHIFIMAQVHAGEVSGRDALLSLLRDWATSTDANIQAYLEEVTLLILPTSRPDSQEERLNPNGANINRDHVELTQPETQNIQSVITTYQPVLVVDVHEGRNITNDYATSKVLNANITSTLAGLSETLEQHVRTAVEGAGYTWEAYQGHNIYGPEFGHNSAGIRHGVGLLLESMRTDAGGNIIDTQRRYQTQVTALESIIEWHSQNLGQVDSAVDSSRQDASGLESINFTEGTSPGVSLDAFEGFQLSPSQNELMATAREVFGLPERNTNGVVDARGDQRVLVHLLMDNRSPHRIVSARPVQDGGDDEGGVPPSSRPSAPTAFYRTSGVTQEVELIAHP